jgi:penicillin-binding protein 2
VSRLGSAGSPAEGHLDRRLVAAVGVVLAVWLVLVARLFYLQVVQGERFRDSAERNSVRTHRVEAPRGMLLDRTGARLVDSRPSFDVHVVPADTERLDETLDRLAALAGVDPALLRSRLGKPAGSRRFQMIRVLQDLDRDALARIEARLWALPGVVTDVRPVRAYRDGPVAAHVLGRLGEIDADQLEKRHYQGYKRGDVIGRHGVERLLDRELRGLDGGENVLVDAHGRELERLGRVEPEPGANVVLTLDRDVQLAAERALDETGKGGAVVALDPRSGRVLALVSRPSFDPNRFARGLEAGEWRALVDGPRKPLHNRALQGQYPPGSTYKIVTALAGLERGVIRPGFRVRCDGEFWLGRRRYRCWKWEKGGHGSVDVHRALVESCDVFFYRVAHELGRQKRERGVDVLAHYGRELGLGRETGIGLGPEATGLVPSTEWKLRRFGEPWMEGETISVAIGQGFNLWTPIQLAAVYGAIGNGGARWRPFVVERMEDPLGRTLWQAEPELLGQLSLQETSLEVVRRGLRGAVHDAHGTGYAMRGLPGGVEAAGKTGTAQVVALGEVIPEEHEVPEEQRDHAWFVTYVPAQAPRITVAVLVEHGGHGASAAAPIARKVVDAFLLAEGARPVEPPVREAEPPAALPATAGLEPAAAGREPATDAGPEPATAGLEPGAHARR